MADVKFPLLAVLLPGRPVENRIIHICIEGLLATDGSSLNGKFESHYLTTFNPFYSNVMRVRLIAGEFLADVLDGTINQLVWYYSYQANLMNYCPERSVLNPTTYANFRARWVTACVVVSLLSGTSINGDLQKRLGDLSIARGRAAQELLDLLRDELGYLTSILEDGGNYGREMMTVSKASGHPDAPIISRMWAPSDIYHTEKVPGANRRRSFVRRSDGQGQSRWKRTWGK